MFKKHGGRVVFFGRFVAVLRAWAAFLAGTNRMPWPRFLAFNAAGGIAFVVLAAAVIVAFVVYLRRNEHRLEEEAERDMPGPLDAYQPGGQRDGHAARVSNA